MRSQLDCRLQLKLTQRAIRFETILRNSESLYSRYSMQIGRVSPNLNLSGDMSEANNEEKNEIPSAASAAKPPDVDPPKKKSAPPRKKSKKPKDMVSQLYEIPRHAKMTPSYSRRVIIICCIERRLSFSSRDPALRVATEQCNDLRTLSRQLFTNEPSHPCHCLFQIHSQSARFLLITYSSRSKERS